jgi:heavy metal translocating P-type ATPase
VRIKRMVRNLGKYKQFSFALLALIVGAIFDGAHQVKITHWILQIAAGLEVFPLLWAIWKEFRSGSYGLDILTITGIIASIVLDKPWVAIVIVLMQTGSLIVEQIVTAKTNEEIANFAVNSPKDATLAKKGKTLPAVATELHPGDRIIVEVGKMIPADAIILSGTAQFDESFLTGDTALVEKGPDDIIYAGTHLKSGEITAKVTAAIEDSYYHHLAKYLRGASSHNTPFIRLAARYSLPFTFAAFAIAITVWTVTGQAIRFLDVIVVATPAPLLLAVPLAIRGGIGRASKSGIYFKSGTILERLADTESLYFTKTKILTEGKPIFSQIENLGAFSDAEILTFAASIEQNNTHPYAQALIAETASRKIKLIKTKHSKQVPNQGVIATIKTHQILVGRLSFLQNENIVMPLDLKPKVDNNSLVYVAIDNSLAAIIHLEDPIRKETESTIKKLKRYGIQRIGIVSGDNTSTLQAIGKKLGISRIHSDLLPVDTLNLFDSEKAKPLVFVGDGEADAPLLTAANVGVAMYALSSLQASETADVAIMSAQIPRFLKAYEIAKFTLRIAIQCIFMGVGISVILMLVFATGKISALYGAIIQGVLDIAILMYALKAHTSKSTGSPRRTIQ